MVVEEHVVVPLLGSAHVDIDHGHLVLSACQRLADDVHDPAGNHDQDAENLVGSHAVGSCHLESHKAHLHTNLLAHGLSAHERCSTLHPPHSRNAHRVHPRAARAVEVGVHVAIGYHTCDESVLGAAAAAHSRRTRHRLATSRRCCKPLVGCHVAQT